MDLLDPQAHTGHIHVQSTSDSLTKYTKLQDARLCLEDSTEPDKYGVTYLFTFSRFRPPPFSPLFPEGEWRKEGRRGQNEPDHGHHASELLGEACSRFRAALIFAVVRSIPFRLTALFRLLLMSTQIYAKGKKCLPQRINSLFFRRKNSSINKQMTKSTWNFSFVLSSIEDSAAIQSFFAPVHCTDRTVAVLAPRTCNVNCKCEYHNVMLLLDVTGTVTWFQGLNLTSYFKSTMYPHICMPFVK